MICYSTDIRRGYLTKDGIKNIKSGLVSNIFHNEMKEIYAEQSHRRDDLKAESKKIFLQLIAKMKTGNVQNPKLELLLLELAEKLKLTKGKRVYGYLSPKLKNIVDSIVDELAKEKTVSDAYNLWYEMRNEVLKSYSDNHTDPIPLSKQKEFKSIKNFIIFEADKLSKNEISLSELEDIEVDGEYENTSADNFLDKDFEEASEISAFTLDEIDNESIKETSIPHVKWSEDYKKARKLLFGTENEEPDFEQAMEIFKSESVKGNVLAVFDLGRIYADGLGVDMDIDKAQKYYAKALEGFSFVENKKPWKYTQYRIGKMFAQGLGIEQNYENAAEWFEKSSSQKYKFAEYSLGGLYYRGQGVEQNYGKAFELYQQSAKQGFPYADFEVAKMFRDGIGTGKNEKQSNIYFKKAFVGFEDLEKQNRDDKLQYRLGWMLQNGIGTEKDIVRAKEYFQKSAKLGNTFACYSLAKIILAEENPAKEEIKSAFEYLKTASDSGNPFAQYALAKLYYDGKYIGQDISKAVELFTYSAEQDNEWSEYRLGKIYLTEDNFKDITSATRWLKQSAEKGNQFAQYVLGKLYLKDEEISKDVEKALQYLTSSAEQGNQFSQYILGKMYLIGQGVAKDKETAVKWFTLSAEQGNEYAKFFLQNMDKWHEPSAGFAVSKLFHHMSRIFEDNIPKPKSPIGLTVDSKLLRKLKQKKMAQGHKQDDYEQNMSF